MSKPYPELVCQDCGTIYGRKPAGDGATWHLGECGVCGDIRAVTEPSDFGQLRPVWDTHKQVSK